MRKTLYGKLTVVLLGLLCLIGISYIPLTLFTTRLYQQEVAQKLNRALAEHLVAEKILMEKHQVNDAALKEVFHMLMVINPSIEIYLLDTNGTILAFSAPPGKVKRQNISLEPVQRFLSGAETFPILGDDPRGIDRQKVFSVSPIPAKGPLEGYLYIVLGGEDYDSVVQRLQGSYILQLSAWAVAAGVLFAGLSGFLLFQLLTRRLRALASVMGAFRWSNFSESPSLSYPWDARRGDEIDRLGATFADMSTRIIQQMQKLNEMDALRRELVVNVSHDLRTPLASLQGYLETLLLKNGTLSLQERQRYIEIALKHSEQLGKLVTELFELAKLESQEIQLHREPFSLGELVQDVAQKFQLAAARKKIQLQTHFGQDLPFVSADIGLIERVLENLSENALRYTPEGGTVTLALRPEREDSSAALRKRNEKIAVQVSDTGCGIPLEDLPHIFDRFYRVKKDAREAVGSAGLGLAIAKRIVELHGSSIEVDSMPNLGTTFTFHLPIYQTDRQGPRTAVPSTLQ